MSSNITKIDYGRQNWHEPVNQNFDNLDTDSGWISVTLLAPFTGALFIRQRAHSVSISGELLTTESVPNNSWINIASLPSLPIRTISFISYTDGTNGSARLQLKPDGGLVYYSSTSDPTTQKVRISETFMI